MENLNVAGLAGMIKNAMAEHYADGGHIEFNYSSFVELGKTDEEILKALKFLADQGRININAIVKCYNGHIEFDGPIAGLNVFASSNYSGNCSKCDENLDFTKVGIYVVITETWKELLDFTK